MDDISILIILGLSILALIAVFVYYRWTDCNRFEDQVKRSTEQQIGAQRSPNSMSIGIECTDPNCDNLEDHDHEEGNSSFTSNSFAMIDDLPYRSSSNINISDLHRTRKRTELAPQLRVHTMKWLAICRVGAGGYSEVFHVIDERTKKSLAMKWIRIEQSMASKDSAKSLLKTYHFESELLSKLNHPNILSYFGRTVTENEMMLYLELAPCGNLSNVLSIYGPLSEHLVIRCSIDVLSALHYLHSLHIVHRDIKASNLLVMSDGGDGRWTIKVSDFGASCRFSETTSEHLDTQGTFNWMAPEIISFTEDNPYGTKVDIWSFGCTLIEMASGGVSPWSELNKFGPQLMYHIATFPDTPRIPGHLSESAESFITNHLDRNANSRSTASALLVHPFLNQDVVHKDDRFQSLLLDLTAKTYQKHKEGLIQIQQRADLQEQMLMEKKSVRERKKLQEQSLKEIQDFEYAPSSGSISPTLKAKHLKDEVARNVRIGAFKMSKRAKNFMMRLENDRDFE